MSRIIIFIPIDETTNISSISAGILYAIKKQNAQFSVCRINLKSCIKDINKNKEDFYISEKLVYKSCVNCLICSSKEIFLKKVSSKVYKVNNENDIILIDGLESIKHCCSIFELNYKIAHILNAEIVLVISTNRNISSNLEKKMQSIQFNKKISGLIINKVDILFSARENYLLKEQSMYKKTDEEYIKNELSKLNKKFISLLGIIPWNLETLNVKFIDIIKFLDVKIFNKEKFTIEKIKSIVLFEDIEINMIKKIQSNSLLVIPFYYFEKIIKYIKKTDVFAILLTDSIKIEANINKLYFFKKMPNLFISYTKKSIYDIKSNLNKLRFNEILKKNIINLDDYISCFINKNWIRSISSKSNISIAQKNFIFSSSYFFYNRISELAHFANKKIVLPEGDEPRTILAASICSKKKIAKCILLGKLDKIHKIAKLNQINLEKNIEIIDPEKVRNNYVDRLVELRKNKGINFESASKILKKDNITLGVLMLENNEVDGLVSGAIHATAKVIRPSLQIIKMFPGNTLVSSIFFMLLPKQILVYGDCAINPNPTIEQLAEIAIQSADSALYFGIVPRIAMISYSTGCSGSGKDVEKVREATKIIKKRRPDLLIDGPLQYDAALVKEVAIIKSPNSPVAGKATVLIFPDLNTGNAVYKAVQRTANINAIGPILQGMRKPVNDLSRGALISDIVYTIAITAIQSKQIEEKLSFCIKK